ncbi:MAG: TetR/AcrR family transcriptional regulator [Anaerolineales bacterium]|nr:TetR/AcrR family transcriptional regulator [Anaerolineales bacterium]
MIENQYEEYDETQQAIIEGAIRAAIKYGFQNLTTKKIAEEAGVNEVTLFRRFGSKTAVLETLFKYEAESIATRAIFYTGNLEEDLIRIVDTLWQAIKKRETLIPAILNELPRNPEIRRYAQHSIKKVQALMEILERYQGEGKLRPNSVHLQFLMLIGPLVFLNSLSDVFSSNAPSFQAESYVAQYLEGQGTNQPPT